MIRRFKHLILMLALGLGFALTGHAARAEPSGSINLCPALNDRQLYKEKENEDFAMMVAGNDGWLFRSHFDLKFRFRLTERTLNSFGRLEDAFRSRGTDLVVVMMPTRGLVHSDELTPAEQESFDSRAAKRSYFKMLEDLRKTGIYMADMNGVDKVDDYFLKRDNHWTYKGAQFTAQSVASTIKELPVYDSLKKTGFVTRAIEEQQTATGRYGDFVNRICGIPIPRESLEKRFETGLKDSQSSEESLFGDSGQPEIVLLGTSNSTNPEPSYANFEGFLKEYLHADILNEAVSGGSLQGSISNFILSGDYNAINPKVIIWEMSAHYGFNQQAFLREIVPAVYGDCGDQRASATVSRSIEGDDKPVLFENLAGKNIQSSKYYVALKLSDKNQRTVKVRFTHADGRTDTVKLERSDRNFPRNHGIFFVELSDVMEAPLDKVSLDLKRAAGTAEARICRVPPFDDPQTADVDPSKISGEVKKATPPVVKTSFLKPVFGNFSWFNGYNVTAHMDKKAVKIPEAPALPDISGYTKQAVLAKMPLLQQGDVRVEDMEGAAPLRKYAFDKRLVEFQNIQKRVEPKAIHIYSGVYDLHSLMQAVSGTDFIVEKQNGYLVRLPIALYPGATLIIKDLDKPLLLSQPKGAFIASAGDLFILNSTVMGWNEEQQKPAVLNEKLDNFRPFITMWDGSEIYIADSKLQDLGYASSKSYGITVSTNDIIQEEFEEEYGDLPPPSGWMINSTFEHLYFGFYSYEAQHVALIGNTYKDNVIYGIDPHDRSEKLIIAYNNIRGSKKKHGIIISREVKDSFIFHNDVRENAGSGIMLDRNSTNNVIAYNSTQFNQGDGITLYESPDNILYQNQIKNNEGSGVRIRNSWNIDIIGGAVAMNKGYAFQLYEDPLTNTGRDFEMDPVTLKSAAAVAGVDMESNGGILKTDNFENVRFENVNMDKGLLSRLPFAGDIAGDAGALIDHARTKPTVLEIKSSS